MRRRIAASIVVILLTASACGRQSSIQATSPSPVPTAAASVRFAAVGDIGEVTRAQRRVGDLIANVHAERALDVLLLLGDVIYPSGDGRRYEELFAEPWRSVLDAQFPRATVLGNHDVLTRDGADVMRLFQMPARYYSISHGPITFFALDTNRLDATQLDWLRGALGSSDTPWRVVFMHVPAYSSGSHGSAPDIQRALDPILREFEVSLVLAGHDHDYERTEPIGGTVHVVAGTGCCVRAVGRSSFTAATASEPGIVLADADAERLDLRFVTADGRTLDRVTLEAPTEARQPTVRGGRR